MGSEILIAGSIAWIIIWSVIGLKLGKDHISWLEKMEGLSKEGDLANFWSTFDGFKMQKAAHAHALCFSCIAFLIGLAMKLELFGYSSTFQTALSIWLLIGVIVASIGDRLRSIPIMALGNILFLTAMIVIFVGLFT